MINLQCQNCKNYLGGMICYSFAEKKIPNEIFAGKHDHSKPIGGEQKDEKGKPILFEPIEKETRTKQQ